MSHRGRDFYDIEAVYRRYEARRGRPGAPNESLEGPAFDEIVGDVRGARIIDLGCGQARWGVQALDRGASSYLGIDASKRMLEAARARLGDRGGLVNAALEEWQPAAASADLVVSRLALHYVEDVGAVLRSAHRALDEAGRLVFSVEHPVITSCDRARAGDEPRIDWVVDGYFDEGWRTTTWMGERIQKYHRSIESWFGVIRECGFQLDSLREGRPLREHFVDADEYTRRARIPLFLILAARRSDQGSGRERAIR